MAEGRQAGGRAALRGREKGQDNREARAGWTGAGEGVSGTHEAFLIDKQ